MTDETQTETTADSDVGGTQTQEVDYKAQVEALMAEKESMGNKINELLGESKKAKDARRQAEQLAADEARKKAAAEGNYEQLFQSSEEQRKMLEEQLTGLTSSIHQKEVKNSALKVASELAEGANVELLAEFIERRLKFAEDGVKVTNESGDLTVSTLDDLRKEFAGSARYASLIKGNQASGGGAAGGSNGASGSKVKTRAEFDALNQHERIAFAKSGGKITN